MASKKENTAELVSDEGGVGEPTRYPAGEGRDQPKYVVATADLYAYGMVAHRAGDRVPSVNVDKHGWGGDVQPL